MTLLPAWWNTVRGWFLKGDCFLALYIEESYKFLFIGVVDKIMRDESSAQGFVQWTFDYDNAIRMVKHRQRMIFKGWLFPCSVFWEILWIFVHRGCWQNSEGWEFCARFCTMDIWLWHCWPRAETPPQAYTLFFSARSSDGQAAWPCAWGGRFRAPVGASTSRWAPRLLSIQSVHVTWFSRIGRRKRWRKTRAACKLKHASTASCADLSKPGRKNHPPHWNGDKLACGNVGDEGEDKMQSNYDPSNLFV